MLMVDSPVPLPSLAKFRIWRNVCVVLASKLGQCVQKTTILTKTIDKSYAQRHTPGSRDKTDSTISILMVGAHSPVWRQAMVQI